MPIVKKSSPTFTWFQSGRGRTQFTSRNWWSMSE